MPDTILLNCEEKMDKCIEALKREFVNIKTGKANPAILNSVSVSYYGVMTPISQVSSISAPDAQTIVVKPWDKSIIKDIEKAIQVANLGFNPNNQGDLLRISIPPLTEETRKTYVKDAKRISEENKVAIRNVRREGVEALKKLEKASSISEDELEIYLEEVQKLTDKFIAKVDDLCKEKEHDIMSI